VRAQMTDVAGNALAENVYWASTVSDDLGPSTNDSQFETKWARLGDMSALNSMPAANATVSGSYSEANEITQVRLRIANKSNRIAFFVRAEITADPDGTEVLPIRYDDNYITIFPRETRAITATFDSSMLAGHKPSLRIEGYDVPKQVVSLAEEKGK
jgi:exo-1,4-beta-D-glucosaminidase